MLRFILVHLCWCTCTNLNTQPTNPGYPPPLSTQYRGARHVPQALVRWYESLSPLSPAGRPAARALTVRRAVFAVGSPRPPPPPLTHHHTTTSPPAQVTAVAPSVPHGPGRLPRLEPPPWRTPVPRQPPSRVRKCARRLMLAQHELLRAFSRCCVIVPSCVRQLCSLVGIPGLPG